MSNKVVFSLLVDNEAGVLSRISGLFSRRSYNIDSIIAGATEDPNLTRLTVVTNGEPEVLDQISKQLAKLIDVREIKVLPAETSVCRELILVNIAVSPEERQQVIGICDIFRAKIVDVSTNSIMMELTGTQNKIDAFLNLLKQYKIIELARTGITGLSRGYADEQ